MPGDSVTVEARELGGDVMAIKIRDTGVGMSEDDMRLALVPFGQIDGSHSRWREGTGLGLPIAKALIELHGGQLDIQSEKGRGTEVTVLLPSAPVQTPLTSHERAP